MSELADIEKKFQMGPIAKFDFDIRNYDVNDMMNILNISGDPSNLNYFRVKEKTDAIIDKLKEDEKGNKISDVRGIRAACKVMKTRYAKPFESVQVKIPYDTGMDPYSGLVDLFEKKGILTQQGNRLKYIDSTGKEHLEFRKAWVGSKLDMLMSDFDKLSIDDQPKED